MNRTAGKRGSMSFPSALGAKQSLNTLRRDNNRNIGCVSLTTQKEGRHA